MRIRITATEADSLIEAIQTALLDVAISGSLVDETTSARARYDIGSIMRETVLEFEERRIAAARKAKPGTPRKRAAKKTTEPAVASA